jgi:hypothetical protein
MGPHGTNTTEVHLGDLDDKVNVIEHGRFFTLMNAFGGPGDDVLSGGIYLDQLYGGPGRDRMMGGEGDDVVADGDLSGAPGDRGPGRDYMDGGPGNDLVSYRQRTANVTVDAVSEAPAGEPGEGDEIHSIEGAEGGSGDDRLTSDTAGSELISFGGSQLIGNAGHDTLVGGNLADELYGGPGRDALHAGGGDDWLYPGKGRDSLFCGPGDDRVWPPEPGELLRRGCELSIWDVEILGDPGYRMAIEPNALSASTRSARFSIGCPIYTLDEDGDGSPCAGTVTVREASGRHRLLGRVHAAGTNDAVLVRLNSLGQALIRRRHGVLVTVSLHGGKDSGTNVRPLPDVAWTIRLRR